MSGKKWNFALSKSKAKVLADPLGFKVSTADVVVKVQNKQGLTSSELQVLTTKSWGVAKSPMQSIFMTLLMFWMTGSGISIWTLMITVSFLLNPVKQLFSIGQVFAPFDGKIPLVLQKATFMALHLVILACAFYKFSAMGIVPDKAIDWQYLIVQQKPHNLAFGLTN